MDADRFAAFLRSLSGSPSRRSALRLLVGSALGSLLTVGAHPTVAKKSKGKKGKGKKKRGGTQPPPAVPPDPGTTSPPPPVGPCDGQPNDTPCAGGTCQNEVCTLGSLCTGRDVNCGQGTDAVCCQAPRNGTATCGSGGSCDFACNEGFKRCVLLGGACIPVGDCCTNSDCPGYFDQCQMPWCDNATGRCGIQSTSIYPWVGTYLGIENGPCQYWICGSSGIAFLDFNPSVSPPDDGNQCTGCGSCSRANGGTAVYPPLPAGTPCSQGGGTHCDGAGNCIA